MGQTGVGKSSLINRLDQNFNRAIGNEVVLGRGEHKTKEVAFLPFWVDIWVILRDSLIFINFV